MIDTLLIRFNVLVSNRRAVSMLIKRGDVNCCYCIQPRIKITLFLDNICIAICKEDDYQTARLINVNELNNGYTLKLTFEIITTDGNEEIQTYDLILCDIF
jgi:hypothetical protein